MDEALERFRAESAQAGTGRGRKFPKHVQSLGAEYARTRRAAGESWQTIAEAMGIVSPTVKRWVEDQELASAKPFHRVAVMEPSRRPSYAAVLPGGLRVEGLELDAIIALARALS